MFRVAEVLRTDWLQQCYRTATWQTGNFCTMVLFDIRPSKGAAMVPLEKESVMDKVADVAHDAKNAVKDAAHNVKNAVQDAASDVKASAKEAEAKAKAEPES